MTWNQNGNGQGNGYGQQQGYQMQTPPQHQVQQNYGGGQEDTYERLDRTAKPVGGARFPFIGGGNHTLALCQLEEFQHSTDGTCARAILKVMKTNTPEHAVGSFVTKLWKLMKPSKFPGQATDADQFYDFCRKLKGAGPNDQIGSAIRTLMKERPAEQLARGTLIDVVGVVNKKGNYVNVFWNSVQQSPQDILAMRQRLEAEGLPTANGPAPQTQQAYNAPPQGQPMQQGQQMQYQQPPQAQYGQQAPQQQYAPPAQNQSYGQPPSYAPQGATGAPTGAPPGGFLANVPPQNGGQGGGNGGSW